MSYRVSPVLWPVLALLSPVLVPVLGWKSRRFHAGRKRAASLNAARLDKASALDLPGLQSLDLTVLVEHDRAEGFLGEAGTSYLLRTERGAVLMDVGFAAQRPAFTHNAAKLGISMADIDALLISHIHLDHIGGAAAQRQRRVHLPASFGAGEGKPCYLPDQGRADGFEVRISEGPALIEAGLATTGPLARMLFFLGWCEEQAVLARLKGRGLVVVTGCGHPTLELILAMVRHLSNEPIHALVGGLHLPITGSRAVCGGIQLQCLLGTGKAPWHRITDDDLSRTIQTINDAAPRRLLVSAHDSCDHALDRLASEVHADVETLRAGVTYHL